MDLTSIVDISRILAGFGAISLVLTFVRHRWERYRWSCYKRYIHGWLSEFAKAEKQISNQPDSWWVVECEVRLTQAGFSPSEIQSLGDLPVEIAKARAYGLFLVKDSGAYDEEDD